MEDKEAKAVARRRAAEAERRERIHDVKQRTLGVDVSALESQRREREARERAEAELQRAHDREQEAIQREVVKRQREQERVKREVLQQEMEYRQQQQTKDTRREWDLNNPEYARSLGETGEGGVSGATRFDGEDLEKKGREEEQRRQMREWLAQQERDKAERQRTERELESLHAKRQQEINERTSELERLQEQTRRAMRMNLLEENRAMAEERSQADKERLIAETLRDLEQVGAITADPVLVEDQSAATSWVDPNRVIPQEFKGMTPAQVRAIQEQQRQQVAAKEEERRREAETKRKWEQQEISVMRAALLREREIERQKREIAAMVRQENSQGASETMLRTAAINQTFANKVTDAFFDQFGTSSR